MGGVNRAFRPRSGAAPAGPRKGRGSPKRTFSALPVGSGLGVGQAAEEQGHHPDLHLAWGKVDVETGP